MAESLPTFASRWPAVVRWVLAAARAVTVPSEFLRREMSQYRSNLLLMPNPLDLAAYSYRRRERPEPHLVLAASVLHHVQPLSLLASRAQLTLIRRRHPGATLTMIGPDRGDGSITRGRGRRPSSFGVRDRIQFLGQVPQGRRRTDLSRGEIFLNTTNVDNTPVSVVEAMACGLCLVSTNVGGMSDLVRDGEEGLLVPPNDPEAMAAAVRASSTSGVWPAAVVEWPRTRRTMDWSAVLPNGGLFGSLTPLRHFPSGGLSIVMIELFPPLPGPLKSVAAFSTLPASAALGPETDGQVGAGPSG